MLRNKIIKIASIGLSSLLVLLFISTITYAANNNYAFSFSIQAHQTNSRVTSAEAKHRSTTNTNDSWKVNLKKSTEVSGTVTSFWLEVSDGTNVSEDCDAKQGAGPYYKKPKAAANQKNVYLTAENNNNNSQIYSVSGVWDEETGILVG